jgi:Asp/Glu/hydantoin racemase
MTDRPADFILGVVMLETRFPRPPGDIGNPASFPFPTLYRTAIEARVATVVTADPPSDQVIRGVAREAARLAADGADLVATSCGFLAPAQDEIQRQIAVPVLSSALVLLPEIRARHGDGLIGVLTIDSRRLARHHFGPYYAPPIAIEGVESGHELHRVISEDRPALDEERAAQDVLDAATRLLDRAPDVTAILFECTNFAPYRARVAAATGLPVYDLRTAILQRAEEKEALGAGKRNA